MALYREGEWDELIIGLLDKASVASLMVAKFDQF